MRQLLLSTPPVLLVSTLVCSGAIVVVVDDQAERYWGTQGSRLEWRNSGPSVAQSSALVMDVHSLPSVTMDRQCLNTCQIMELFAMAAEVRLDCWLLAAGCFITKTPIGCGCPLAVSLCKLCQLMVSVCSCQQLQ